jgi:hypothetical protein
MKGTLGNQTCHVQHLVLGGKATSIISRLQLKHQNKNKSKAETFILVRRTGDSSSAEGENPGGIVRRGSLEMGSLAGDIVLYRAPLAAADNAETLRSGEAWPFASDISSWEKFDWNSLILVFLFLSLLIF